MLLQFCGVFSLDRGCVSEMKVLICSSSRENLELCAGRVDALAKRHGILVRVEEWSSGRPLVDSYSKEPFDLLYLDTALKDMDGMEVARRLRLAGLMGDIVFFTEEREPVFQAFDVDALHYLVKGGAADEKFESVFLKAVARMKRRTEETLLLSCAGVHRRVPIDDILYFEVTNRIITVHYGAQTFEFYSTLSKIEELLYGRGFWRPHRAYLISERHIRETREKEILLTDGTLLPMSQRYAGRRRG